MKKQHEKLMTDFQRLIETQDFKSEEDLKAFMNNYVGEQIPSFPEEVLNSKEKAQDLVYEAYDLSALKGKKNIEHALELDSDCIEAYEYLGSIESSLEIAMTFFKKGVDIGRKIYGGKYLANNKGMFWGLHETRPFMRCLQQYSDCLYFKGEVKECVTILEEMIELNPNDNQGVRDQLLLYLIELEDFKKFDKYSKMYNDDENAFSLFNRALYTFKKEGESENSNMKLKKAIKQNKFVITRLLSTKPITKLDEYFGIGDDSEAKYYASFAQHIWGKTKGAVDWLKKMK